MNTLIWYPKCSTCQKAFQSLQNKNIKLELRDIKEDTPSKEELKVIWQKSNEDIKKLFNTSGLKYKELNLKEKLPQMSNDKKLELLCTDGMLIKRPILILQDKIIIGYKEQEYNKI